MSSRSTSSERRTLAAAIVCALLAGALTFAYTGRADRAATTTTPVLISGAPISAGQTFDQRAVQAARVQRVPTGLRPPDALADSIDLAGARATVDLPSGTLLTRSLVTDSAAGSRFRLRSAERAVSVDVVVAANEQLPAGSRVDLYASGFGGNQRTAQLIAAAEVLAAEDRQSPSAKRLTLRLSSAQVAAVVRGDVFARELRAVALPEQAR